MTVADIIDALLDVPHRQTPLRFQGRPIVGVQVVDGDLQIFIDQSESDAISREAAQRDSGR